MLEFTLTTYPQYRPGWFHRHVCAELDQFVVDVEAGRRPRLILSAPPQHGKSELVSRRLPAYALGRNPDLGIIATSHTAELAATFSRDVQRVIDSEAYHWLFPDTRIVGQFAKQNESTRHVGRWGVVGHRGIYRACGVGGAITGMRADILIIDDPVKNDQEANSPLIRDRVFDWFRSTAYTRLSEGGGVIVIMTRWHEDDLVGRIVANASCDGSEPWRVVIFPAIAEADELHRKAGEPLSIERFSLASLLAIKRTIGSQMWEALYQQCPAPAEGAILKRAWISFYRVLPDNFDEVVQSWDCSFNDSKGSDYVAGQVWGRKGGQFYLLDRVHEHMDFPQTISAVRSLSAKWPQATEKLVENKANGPAVISMLRDQLPGMVPINPEGTKQSRMSAISPLFESRNVHFPDPSLAPWIHDVVAEVVAFPHSRHDDDCDAMTQALLALLRRHSSVGLFQLGIVEYPGELPQLVQDRMAGVYESVVAGNPMTPEDEDTLLFASFLHDLLTKDDKERFGDK